MLQQCDKVSAALAPRRCDEMAAKPVESARHRNFPGLSRGRHAQTGAARGPGAPQIRMRQGLAFIGKQQHDIARHRLSFAQLQLQANTAGLACGLAALQRVARPAEAEPPFFRSTLESCGREMEMPSRASISLANRASVQFVRSATGCDSSGPATRSAAPALNGEGPGATVDLSAPAPQEANSLRHSRTVSSRTPNASAICGLVQTFSVSKMARARFASPRSNLPASVFSIDYCSSVAATGDLPAMSNPGGSMQRWNHSQSPLARPNKPA